MTPDAGIKVFQQVAGEQRYYPLHLAEIIKTQSVTIIGDVYNDQGKLVVSKGTSIDYSVAERLLRYRLHQPLEQMIRLEKAMTQEDLVLEFERMFDHFPDAGKINESLKFQKRMNLLTSSYLADPVLMQELTILKERLPRHFSKTLLCTWLSTLIASELGAPEEVVQDSYLAGLAHDIGFLHIAESTIRQLQPLTPNRWRDIQSHVILGSSLLEKLYGRDSGAARAVLEHHERIDGSGYPLGKTGDHLELAGRVTGLADTIQAIRIDRFEPKGRNLRDLSPFLKINSGRIGKELCDAAHSILHRSGLPFSSSNPYGNAKSQVDALASRNGRLREALLLLQELDESIRISVEIGKRKIKASVLSIKETARSTRMASEEIVHWIVQLQQDPSAASHEELTEMELMQEEIIWQLRNIYRLCNHEIDAGKQDDPGMENLSGISKKIYACIAEDPPSK